MDKQQLEALAGLTYLFDLLDNYLENYRGL